MTANHARAMWQMGVGLSRDALVPQFGLRRSKSYPFTSVDDEIAHDHSSYSIRPYAVPNPFTADQWGVSLPAGLVLLLTAAGTSGAGDFAARFDAYLQWVWSNGSSPGTLVPGVLPSGYTPNLLTPWVVSQTNYFDARSAIGYVASASGWTSQVWRPDPNPNGYDSGLIAMNWTAAHNAWCGYATSVGFRSLQVRGYVPNGELPPALIFGAFTLSGTHNANGSSPGNADGDTSDWSTSFAASDWAVDGVSIATSWKTLSGGALATRGTMTSFVAHAVNSSDFAYPSHLQFRLSPRLDVPWPMTVTGEADLIAPGGTP